MSEITVKADELLNGIQVGIVTKEIELPAGTWERGTLLGIYSGTYGQIGDTNYGAETFDCVLADDLTLSSSGKAVGYFAGEFNEELVKVKDSGSATVADVKEHARKLQVYIG